MQIPIQQKTYTINTSGNYQVSGAPTSSTSSSLTYKTVTISGTTNSVSHSGSQTCSIKTGSSAGYTSDDDEELCVGNYSFTVGGGSHKRLYFIAQ